MPVAPPSRGNAAATTGASSSATAASTAATAAAVKRRGRVVRGGGDGGGGAARGPQHSRDGGRGGSRGRCRTTAAAGPSVVGRGAVEVPPLPPASPRPPPPRGPPAHFLSATETRYFLTAPPPQPLPPRGVGLAVARPDKLDVGAGDGHRPGRRRHGDRLRQVHRDDGEAALCAHARPHQGGELVKEGSRRREAGKEGAVPAGCIRGGGSRPRCRWAHSQRAAQGGASHRQEDTASVEHPPSRAQPH